jgi:two-component system, response regulator PdtaR
MISQNFDVSHAAVVAHPIQTGGTAHADMFPSDRALSGKFKDAPRLLVVEDDFLLSMDIETALVSVGYEVVGNVKSAQEAVKIVATEQPDLAIMDVRLNGKHDGVDAAIVMFKAYGVRCIFATARADGDTQTRAEPAAPIGWLQKPYTMDALLDAVEQGVSKLAKEQ